MWNTCRMHPKELETSRSLKCSTSVCGNSVTSGTEMCSLGQERGSGVCVLGWPLPRKEWHSDPSQGPGFFILWGVFSPPQRRYV